MQPLYLGNLPLHAGIIGGIVALILVGCAVVALLRAIGSSTAFWFVVVYVVMGASTSSLWLMQSWIFVGIAVFWRARWQSVKGSRVPARV